MWPLPTSWIIGGVALAAALSWGGVQTYRLGEAERAATKAEAATLKLQAAWDAEKVTLLTAAITATTAARDTETRWQGQQKEALHVAQKATDAARADAAAALDAVGRLRQRAAATAASGCAAPAGAGAASPGAAASAPDVVLADVLGQLAEAGRLTSEFADRAVTAGQACESSWPSSTAISNGSPQQSH